MPGTQPPTSSGLPIVTKIEEGMDPRKVHCTTYQMRNPFKQFYDGVAGELDVHCYFQHAAAADLCPKGGRVLDVCCGRGLLIPFLRYRLRGPSLYVGVDIHAQNAQWRTGQDPRRPPGTMKEDGWDFDLAFVESDVATMSGPIRAAVGTRPFDLVVYTSAIEHMQPAAQKASLIEAGKVSRAGAKLYLSCPVTPEGRSGYSTQFAAHVYEPNMREIRAWLVAGGWTLQEVVGLSTKAAEFRQRLKGPRLEMAERMYRAMPREQALPAIAATFPESATEVAFICERRA